MRAVRLVVLANALALFASACGTSAPPAPAAAGRVVDLGHPLSEADPTWSGAKVYTHTTLASIEKDTMFAARFATDEHFGTHVDAPAHFAAAGATVDRIPADRLVRPALVVNVERQVAADEDYRVTLADLQAFERDHGPIPEGAIVLVATGWDRRWPDAGRYMNVRDGAKHFPGLTIEAAAFLARDRKVAAIGIDTPSVDYGPSTAFEVHRLTQPLGVYHVENAANLTSLPATGFMVVVAPVNVQGGSGAPTRVFALIGWK